MNRSIRAGTLRSKRSKATTEVVNQSRTLTQPAGPPVGTAADADSPETGILDSIRLVNVLRLHLDRETALANPVDDVNVEQLRRIDAISRLLISIFSGDAQQDAPQA